MKKKYECHNNSCSYYNYLNHFDDELCSSCVFRKAINESSKETTVKLSKISYLKSKTELLCLDFCNISSLFFINAIRSRTNILKR